MALGWLVARFSCDLQEAIVITDVLSDDGELDLAALSLSVAMLTNGVLPLIRSLSIVLAKIDFQWFDSSASASYVHSVELIPANEKSKLEPLVALPLDKRELVYNYNFMWSGKSGSPGIPSSAHRDGSCAPFFALQIRGQKKWHIEHRGSWCLCAARHCLTRLFVRPIDDTTSFRKVKSDIAHDEAARIVPDPASSARPSTDEVTIDAGDMMIFFPVRRRGVVCVCRV